MRGMTLTEFCRSMILAEMASAPGLSQRKWAQKAGVSPSGIRCFIKGAGITIEYLEKLASARGKTAFDYLLPVRVECVHAHMAYCCMYKKLAAERFLELQARARIKLRPLSKLMGYKTPSGLQRYLNPKEFTDEFLPLSVARRLDPAIVGMGDPENPITRQDVYDLAGVTAPTNDAPVKEQIRRQAKATAWEFTQIAIEIMKSKPPGTDPAEFAAEIVEETEKLLAKRGI